MLFRSPHNSWSQQSLLAGGTFGEVGGVDGCGFLVGIHVGDSGFHGVGGGCKTGILWRVDGERGVEGVVEVVEFNVITFETFYVEEASVQEFELLSWVICSL